MKVLLVTHAYPPHSRGGVETYTRALARALARAGAEPTILARRPPAPGEPDGATTPARDGELPVIWMARAMDRAPDFEGLYRSAAVDAAFSSLLAAERPEVVHFMHLTCLSTGLPALARAAGARVVATLHDYWPICPRGQMQRPDGALCDQPDDARCARCVAPWLALSPAARAAHGAATRVGLTAHPVAARLLAGARHITARPDLEALRQRNAAVLDALARAHALVSPSEDLAGRTRRAAPTLPAIRVSPYGFELAPLAAARRERPAPGPLQVGFAGSLIPSKGADLLLAAAADITPELLHVHVHGALPTEPALAPYAARLRRLAARAPATLHGAFDPDERARILRGLDVLVVPSTWWENAPLTLQEAWAAGLPVIASNLGGMRELLRRHGGGWLTPPGDARALRHLLVRLATHPQAVRRQAEAARPPRAIDDDAAWHLRLYTEPA